MGGGGLLLAGVGSRRIYGPTGRCVKVVLGFVRDHASLAALVVKMKRREWVCVNGKTFLFRRWIMISIFENVRDGARSVWVCELIQTYASTKFFWVTQNLVLNVSYGRLNNAYTLE